MCGAPAPSIAVAFLGRRAPLATPYPCSLSLTPSPQSRPADEQPRHDTCKPPTDACSDAQELLTDACSDACLGTIAAAVEELVCAAECADSGNTCQTDSACW